MKYIFSLSFGLVFLFIAIAGVQQRQLIPEESSSKRRVALVIGNSAYETAPLRNPINDASDMAQALRELGFDVINKENLNRNDMKRAIRAFGEKLRGGGVGLFYYAGHGVQVKGINYLVPVDAKVESEEEIEYECLDTGLVLAQMESAGNSMNIVILDACRNNPFARSFRSTSRGLAPLDAPSGTLVAYATAPGSIASDGGERNGLYTQELLKNMRTPKLSVEEVFKRVRIALRNKTQGKQTPWESSSLVGDFYFLEDTPVAQPRTRDAYGYFTLGFDFYQKQKFAEAEAACREAIRLDPNYNQIYQLLGSALYYQGKLADAETAYRKAVQLDPNNSDRQYDLGLALFQQRKFAEAEIVFRESARLSPNNAERYRNLGSALLAQQKLKEAEAVYRQALRLEPNKAQSHAELGFVLFQQQKYAEAEAKYREAIRIEPTNTQYQNDLKAVLNALNK
jgi:cytochrome c-type biogenesis protein CcmH/NrfG